MDTLVLQLDIANKKGNYTSSKVLGAYSTVKVSLYNFDSANLPDLQTLKAVIYAQASGRALSNCTAFVKVADVDRYDATLTLSTDNAMAFFADKAPDFTADFVIAVSDGNTLYCNTVIPMKNNPVAVPSSPTPVTVYFVMEAPTDGKTYARKDGSWTAIDDEFVATSDEGFTVDLEGQAEVKDLTDSSNAGQVRRFVMTVAKVLKEKGVI